MHKHVAILGFIYAGLAVLSGLAGVLIMVFGFTGGLATWIGGGEGAGAAGGLIALAGGGIGAVVLVGAGLSGLTAVGLLSRRPWGRVLAIVASVLNLFPPTWMTFLGVYGLWVLLSSEGGKQFR